MTDTADVLAADVSQEDISTRVDALSLPLQATGQVREAFEIDVTANRNEHIGIVRARFLGDERSQYRDACDAAYALRGEHEVAREAEQCAANLFGGARPVLTLIGRLEPSSHDLLRRELGG